MPNTQPTDKGSMINQSTTTKSEELQAGTVKLLIEKTALVTTRFIKGEIDSEGRENVYDEVFEGFNQLLNSTRTKALEEAITRVCSDDEVHCDYSCHVCGGVKEFLSKLRQAINSDKEPKQ